MDSSLSNNSHQNGLGADIWSILLLASICFLMYFGRTIIGPLLPALERDLNLGHADSGGLFIFLSLGYFFSLLGSGFIAGMLGHRRTIVLSAIGVGITLIAVAASNSLWALRSSLTVLGLASGLYLPSGIAALTTLVSPTYWGKAIGIHDMAPNLSFITAPALAVALLGWTSWRGVYIIFGGIAVFIGLAFIRLGPSVPGLKQFPNPSIFKKLLRTPSLWIMCFLFSVGAAGMWGVYNMLPLYLTTVHNFEISSANLVVALSRVSCIGMVLVSGWATDILGPRRIIAWVLACSGCLSALIGLESGIFLVVVIFLQPAVASCFFPAGLAAVSKLFPFEIRNFAIAITVAFSGLLGYGLISALMGVMAEYGMFGAGLVINGAIILTGLSFLPFLRFRTDMVN